MSMKMDGRCVAALALFAALACPGCVVQKRDRVLPPSPAAVSPPPVEGVWRYLGKTSKPMQMTFEPGGRLTFQGGMEFYNPSRWEYDAGSKELTLTLPDVEGNKLQVFQLYVGDAVKAFNPQLRQVTYHFDDATGTLNVAGWVFSKEAEKRAIAEEEPQLK